MCSEVGGACDRRLEANDVRVGDDDLSDDSDEGGSKSSLWFVHVVNRPIEESRRGYGRYASFIVKSLYSGCARIRTDLSIECGNGDGRLYDLTVKDGTRWYKLFGDC